MGVNHSQAKTFFLVKKVKRQQLLDHSPLTSHHFFVPLQPIFNNRYETDKIMDDGRHPFLRHCASHGARYS